jgi:hypothetical protein
MPLIDIAVLTIVIHLAFYQKCLQLCLQMLLYVQKHQIQHTSYCDFKLQNAKITIYNNLVALNLGRAVQESHK